MRSGGRIACSRRLVPPEVRRITAPEPPPPQVDTRLAGRLEFVGGFPTEETMARVYDLLDFQRACQVFLRHMLGASMWSFGKVCGGISGSVCSTWR